MVVMFYCENNFRNVNFTTTVNFLDLFYDMHMPNIRFSWGVHNYFKDTLGHTETINKRLLQIYSAFGFYSFSTFDLDHQFCSKLFHTDYKHLLAIEDTFGSEHDPINNN